MRTVFTLSTVPSTLDMRLLNTCSASIFVNGTLIHQSTFAGTNYVRVALDADDLSILGAGDYTVASKERRIKKV